MKRYKGEVKGKELQPPLSKSAAVETMKKGEQGDVLGLASPVRTFKKKRTIGSDELCGNDENKQTGGRERQEEGKGNEEKKVMQTGAAAACGRENTSE